MVDIPKKLTNFNLFVEGKGFAGIVTKVTLPKITQKMSEHRAGGMNAPREYSLGIEKLEASFHLASFEPEPFRLMGLRRQGPAGLIFRGTLQHYQEVVPLVATIRGQIVELDTGDIEAGNDTGLTCRMSVVYYKLVRGVENLVEIDVDNMVESYGGVDQLEVIRNILKI